MHQYMRGNWHFDQRRLHILGNCKRCPSHADQATRECSESMPKAPAISFWSQVPELMWHWNSLPTDPATSRSPCLSHLSVFEFGGGILRTKPSLNSHDWATTDQKFSVKDAVKFGVEGRWHISWGLKFVQNKHEHFAAKQNFATFLPCPKLITCTITKYVWLQL